MATSSAYYINSLDFSTATAVYLDITLQTKASDGYYSFDGSVRRQVSGLLNSIMVCPTATLNYFTLNYDTTCLAACTAPVPVVNCVVSDWSACINGIQTRSVITPASGGGTACPAISQSCTVPVVNCVVSDWSACVDGTQTRSVITPASGGGTACPVLSQSCTVAPVVNCVVSDWSGCVNGIQTRSVITPASGGGTACPVLSQSCAGITPMPGINYFSYSYDYVTGVCPEEDYYVCETATVARWLSKLKFVSNERYETGIQGYFTPYDQVLNNPNIRYETYFIDPIPSTSPTNRVYNVSGGGILWDPTDRTQVWNNSELTQSYNNKKVVQFQTKTPDDVWFLSRTFNPPYTLYPTSEYYFTFKQSSSINHKLKSTITITPTVANIPYTITLLFDHYFYANEPVVGTITTTSIVGSQTFTLFESAVGGGLLGKANWYYEGTFKYYIQPAQTDTPVDFEFNATIVNQHIYQRDGTASATQTLSKTSNQVIPVDFINGFKPIGMMSPEESYGAGDAFIYELNSVTEQTYAVIVRAKNINTKDVGDAIVYGAGKNGGSTQISAPTYSIPESGKSGGWLLNNWNYSNGAPTGVNTYPNHSPDYGPWLYVELQPLLTY